jgi:chitodextrinase
VLVQGTAADAENALQSVLVRIDSAGWQTASGTSSWSLPWDTRPLTGGSHTVTARAFDGVQNSSDVRVTVQVGHQPVCSIISPASGAVLTGEVTVQGTATDSDPGDVIAAVRVRIDTGEWATATGTGSWTYRWNSSAGSSGQHVIRARCSDGTLESAEVSRTVTVEKPPAPVSLSEPTETGVDYIVLHWTTNTDSDFARYEVFLSETEGHPLSGLSPRAVPAQSVTVYNCTGLAARTTYWFRVRVVDTSGQSSVSNEVFATTARANLPPVAILTASRMRAAVGESISFSAQGSYDRDGRIARYQWDFDGKGRFPLDTGPIAEQRHQFDKAGRFLVQVKITDDRGGTNTSSVEVTIAVAVILVAGVAAYLYFRRAPPQENYYEDEVHRPVVERRKDFWPEDEEPAGHPRKVVKKRRV